MEKWEYARLRMVCYTDPFLKIPLVRLEFALYSLEGRKVIEETKPLKQEECDEIVRLWNVGIANAGLGGWELFQVDDQPRIAYFKRRIEK